MFYCHLKEGLPHLITAFSFIAMDFERKDQELMNYSLFSARLVLRSKSEAFVESSFAYKMDEIRKSSASFVSY